MGSKKRTLSVSQRDGCSRHPDPGGCSALLTDAQKPAVAARVRLNRYFRVAWLALGAGLVLLVRRKAPGSMNRDSILLFTVLWIVAVNASENLTLRRVIAGLPPAADKMSVTDMLAQQTRAMSVKTLVTLTLIFLAGAAFYGYLWFAHQWRDFTGFIAIYSGGFAIIWFAMLFAKLTRKVR